MTSRDSTESSGQRHISTQHSGKLQVFMPRLFLVTCHDLKFTLQAQQALVGRGGSGRRPQALGPPAQMLPGAGGHWGCPDSIPIPGVPAAD